jgi:hypothetical protein
MVLVVRSLMIPRNATPGLSGIGQSSVIDDSVLALTALALPPVDQHHRRGMARQP